MKAQDIINEVEKEDFLLKQKYSKVSRANKNFRYFIWTIVGILMFGAIGVFASNYISDNYSSFGGTTDFNVTNTTEAYNGQMYFGNTYGTFNETCPNRPFTSNAPRTITVNASGGSDYTTIQEAVCQVPFILRHEYRINVADGTYNEDVYIPTTITSGINNPATEGSVVMFQIDGNSKVNTKVKSFHATSIIGTWGLTISDFNVYGQEFSSDENASISVYASNSVLLIGINFTANVQYGVLGYGSGVYLHGSNFNGNQNYGMQIKRGGFGKFGDDYNNQNNNGSVNIALVTASQSFIDVQEYNNVSAPKITICSDENEGLVTYGGRVYCISSSLYNERVSSDNLVLYLDGSSFSDKSGNGLKSYNYSNVGIDYSGKFGKAYEFNGVSSILRINSSETFLGGLNRLTINHWIKANSTQPASAYTIRGSNDNVGFSINTDGTCSSFVVLEQDGDYVNSGTGCFQKNAGWTMLTGVYDSQTGIIKLYIDGVLSMSSTSNVNNVTQSNAQYLTLGWEGTSTRYFNGSIDETMIWQRALTDDEISSLYTQNIEFVSNNAYLLKSGGTVSGNTDFSLQNITQVGRACFTSNCSVAYLRYNGSCIVSSNDAEATCI